MQSSYLIISGTQRMNSQTLKLCHQYQSLLQAQNVKADVLALQDLPMNYFDINDEVEGFIQLQKDIIIPASKFIFVVPEYNGSIPGSIKMLMDNCDIKNCFWGKKAALVGVSDGRNGNLRGLDHLTGILNYLKINVHHYKVNIPMIGKIINEQKEITDEHILRSLHKQIEEFIAF